MNILYDSQIFDALIMGGISNMFCELYKNDLLTDNILSKISILHSLNIHINETLLLNNNAVNNRQFSIDNIKDGNYDIFYPTFFDPYFLNYLNDKPFVMSVHDMIPELYPLYFGTKDMQIVNKKILCPKAYAIEVPTECTKNDLVNILHINPDKIYVVGRGASTNFDIIKCEKPIYDFKYILYVGNRDFYKNFEKFLKEVSPFILKHSDVNIVCTGRNFSYQEFMFINKYGLTNRITSKTCSTEELCNLYLHALCFVYPSDYEGFGIPILEAYKSNCLVLLNDILCFREVASEAAIYFNINNEGDLNNKLEYISNLSDVEKLKILQKQKERDSLYSWSITSLKLYSMYNDVLNNI